MVFPPHKDFAFSTVAVAPVPPDSGTELQVKPNHGGRFAESGPQKLVVFPADGGSSPQDFEVIVATRTGDRVTFTRGNPRRAIRVGDNIAQHILASDLEQIESFANEIKAALDALASASTSGITSLVNAVANLSASVQAIAQTLDNLKDYPFVYLTMRNSTTGLNQRVFLQGEGGDATLAPGGVLLPGAELLWDADTGVTANPASAWATVSGEVSLVQSTVAFRPAVTAAVFGATAGLTFDGVNDHLTAGKMVTAETEGTVGLVFKTGASVAGPFVLISQANTAVANDWFEIGIGADGKLYVESNAGGTRHTVCGSTLLEPNTTYDLTVSYDGTDFYVSLNGQEENPLNIVNAGVFAWFGRVTGTVVFAAGATITSGGVARPFNGVLGHIRLWSTDQTAPE